MIDSGSNKRYWISFAAIAAPFILWLALQFQIIGINYWDRTTNYNLEFWIYSSMGWDLSKWSFLLLDAAYGFRSHYPAIPEAQLAALYGAVFGWPGENLTDFSRLGIWLNIVVIGVAAAWGAAIAKSHKIAALPLFAGAANAQSVSIVSQPTRRLSISGSWW